MRYVSAVGAGLLLAVVALGCSIGDEQSPPRPLVSDSAGVVMVTTTGADRPLATRQTMRVGVVEGDLDLQFYQIRSIAIDSAGDFWVSDSHESIRHYDPSGTYLGAVGGEGGGPGEAARGYGDVWVNRGTVIASAPPGMLQAFAADDSFLGSRSTRPALGAFMVPLGASGSRWTYRIQRLQPTGATQAVTEWTIVAGTFQEAALDTVATLAGGHFRALGGVEIAWVGASYFEGSPAVRGDQNGRTYHSHPLEYRVDVYGANGQLRQVVSRQTPATPYPEGLRDEIEAGVRREFRGPDGDRPISEAQVEKLTTQALPLSRPEHIPYIETLLVSGDGHIWVLRADRHPRPAMRAVAGAFGYIRSAWADEWRAPLHVDLFGPDGTYRGSIELPTEFVPMAVTKDQVIGSEYDELDVEYVVAYTVIEQP